MSIVNFQFSFLCGLLKSLILLTTLISLPLLLIIQDSGSFQEFIARFQQFIKFISSIPAFASRILSEISDINLKLNGVDRIVKAIEEIEDDVDDIERKLTTLSRVVDSLEATVSEIAISVDALLPIVSGISTETTAISGVVVEFIPTMAGMVPHVTSIDTLVAAMDTTLDTVAASTTDLAVDVTAISAAVTGLVPVIGEIAASSTEISASTTAALAALTAFFADYFNPLVTVGFFKAKVTNYDVIGIKESLKVDITGQPIRVNGEITVAVDEPLPVTIAIQPVEVYFDALSNPTFKVDVISSVPLAISGQPIDVSLVGLPSLPLPVYLTNQTLLLQQPVEIILSSAIDVDVISSVPISLADTPILVQPYLEPAPVTITNSQLTVSPAGGCVALCKRKPHVPNQGEIDVWLFSTVQPIGFAEANPGEVVVFKDSDLAATYITDSNLYIYLLPGYPFAPVVLWLDGEYETSLFKLSGYLFDQFWQEWQLTLTITVFNGAISKVLGSTGLVSFDFLKGEFRITFEPLVA